MTTDPTSQTEDQSTLIEKYDFIADEGMDTVNFIHRDNYKYSFKPITLTVGIPYRLELHKNKKIIISKLLDDGVTKIFEGTAKKRLA